MSGKEVSTSVISIIAAFTSGLDILRKVRGKYRRSKVKNKDVDLEKETRLDKSLKRGTFEIENEYAAGLSTFGERFMTGDGKFPRLHIQEGN